MRYRPVTLDDAALAADVMTAAYPALAQDPVITRWRWESPRQGFAYGRFLAEEDSRPIAFLAWVHGSWAAVPDRHCEVEVWLDQAELGHGLYQSLWDWIGDQAVAEGTALLLAYAAEDETESLAALAALGYERARIEKVWELDLIKHGPRLLEEASTARQKMTEEGIRLETVTAWQDPEKLHKLHRLNADTVQDVPHSLPIVEEPYEDFVKRMDSPDRPHDKFWVARHGDQPVAMSYLKFPPVRGSVWTGFTCTHRDYRGRGIARAVKLQSLAQAIGLGVPFVCTDNDSENAPMLHINEKLGYHRRPGFVEHHKRVHR